MIYCFSGTGNSRFVARQLSRLIGENCIMLQDIDPLREEPHGESVGFVFPVYSWGVAPPVSEFIDRLPESFWLELDKRHISVWCVMTCGDEVALAPEMFRKALSRHGVRDCSVWSVTMPNNYVLLPGFDVDPRDVEKKKLAEAPARIQEIARGIHQGMVTTDVVRGPIPWIKTKLVYPLFRCWGIFPKKWHSTLACVGCGICASACPNKNIAMSGRRPVWSTDCCSCLACYHSCPRHAVEYGNVTRKKGQYMFPAR